MKLTQEQRLAVAQVLIELQHNEGADGISGALSSIFSILEGTPDDVHTWAYHFSVKGSYHEQLEENDLDDVFQVVYEDEPPLN